MTVPARPPPGAGERSTSDGSTETNIDDQNRHRTNSSIEFHDNNRTPITNQHPQDQIFSTLLAEDGVDSQVGDVFFVVEGSDVGGDEGFDAVSESSGGFGEGHASAEPRGRGGVAAVVDA